jgi:hypothetical protein
LNDAGRGLDEDSIQIARVQGEFQRGFTGQLFVNRVIDFQMRDFWAVVHPVPG